MALVEPDPAAHGQVVIQRHTIVTQGGCTEQDEQVVEICLLAVVGIQLRCAVRVEHPVGFAVGIVGEAGGVLCVKLDPDTHCVRSICIGQLAVFLHGQQIGHGEEGSALAVGAAGRGVCDAGFCQGRGDVQAAQHAQKCCTAGMPQRDILPIGLTGKGIGAHLQRVYRAQRVVIKVILVKLSAAPLYRQYLLAHQQPPVEVLPGRDRPDLRHGPHGRVDQAEPGGLLLCGQGFQHQRGCGKPPLSGAGGRVVNGDGDRPLARPDKFLPSERVSGTFGGLGAGAERTACQQCGAERKTEQSAHPKAFHRFPSSAPEGG